jgi:hypothetical protein
MKQVNVFSAIALAVLLGAGSFSFSQAESPQRKGEAKMASMQQRQSETYSCPMHPEVVSDKPGKCSKCGMNLEKKESAGSKGKSEMKMDAMCAEMCMMMMNDPAMMKMMHPPKADMMGGMGDMKDMKEKPDDAMRMKAMEKMKSCCGMMKNK